jgi:hypothetical protein
VLERAGEEKEEICWIEAEGSRQAGRTKGNGREKLTKPQIKWERPINERDL